MITIDLSKIPTKHVDFFFLGKYWKSIKMVAVARGCALPGSQLQEESETVSALASLTVDVEQPFAQEDGRYGASMGGNQWPGMSRLSAGILELSSCFFFAYVFYFLHLLSPKPQMTEYIL